MSTVSTPPKKENVLINLLCNLIVPTVVLMRFSTDRWLGPLWGLVVAVSFPLGYGIYDLLARRKTNLLSVLGTISVLLSGGLGLMKVGGFWFAVKDASIPIVIGIAVLFTSDSKKSLIRELFFNEQLLDVGRINTALDERQQRPAFDRLVRNASVWLAVTFLGCAVLNFALARYILRAAPGTTEFNEQLGKMHWLMPLVVAVPSMAAMMAIFWKLLNGVGALTGLTSDEIMRAEQK